MTPPISIITANYNKANFISETVHSVLNQTYQNWELIIVDDSSTDDSISIINQFTHDKRIHLLKNNENKGANFCRNFGLQKAKGEYVVFLDADDLLDKSCLENRIKKAKENPDGNLFVFAMGVFKKEIGDDTRKWIPNSQKPLTDFLQHKLPWSIIQPLWKKDFLISLNGFDETFERLQDVELHTRALLHRSVKVYQFPGIKDCYYRIDEERKNFNEFEFLQRRIKSSVQYCNKFVALVEQKQKRFLLGTVLQSYFSIIYALRNKKLAQKEFLELGHLLFSAEIMQQEVSFVKQILFRGYCFYNLYLLRISGINRIFTLLIIK
ncbi:MAG: glycosyltransferase [Bacteroidetes bacterium]|nr:glycosyltransferase [Bacteroidota bacterium]